MPAWGMAAMMSGTLLLIVLAGVPVLMLAQHLNRPAAVPQRLPAPREILALRLARGEIDDEEYRRRLALLMGSAPDGRG